MNYRDYKYFENDRFRTDLLSEFGKANIEEKENGINNLLNACKRILDIHAPIKQTYARGNHMPFMNKVLSKETMTRTRLRNKFLKDRSEENKKRYSKQRNYCVSLLRKSRWHYFENLHEKNINNNKTFWKTIKPFLSDKVRSTNKTTLIDKEEIITGDYNTAKVLNTFFFNIVSNLNIAEYSNCQPIANNISDPVLKCVVKYRIHPSILAIREVCNKHPRLQTFDIQQTFSFSKINREEILRGILKLETSGACKDTDIPPKIIKENADIFADILFASFNDSVEKSNLLSSLKKVNITPIFKKMTEILRITTDQSPHFQICLKYLNNVFFVNYTVLCLNSCQNTSAVFAKVTVRSIACWLCLKSGSLQLIKKNHLMHY